MSWSVRLQAALAGVGVVVSELVPLALIRQAAGSGSVGDLSDTEFLGVGLTYSLALAVLVAVLMAGVVRRARRSPDLGPLDPWGAYALGLGIHNLLLTAVPAILLLLLRADENDSLRDRIWLVELLWIGGHVLAAVAAIWAARALLGRALEPSTATATSPSGTPGDADGDHQGAEAAN